MADIDKSTSQLDPIDPLTGNELVALTQAGQSKKGMLSQIIAYLQSGASRVSWGNIIGNLADQADIQSALSGKASTSHTHAIAQITGLQADLNGRALANHTHPLSAITGLVAALAGKSDVGHTHLMSEITGLVTALAGKASANHVHEIAAINGLLEQLLAKADVRSLVRYGGVGDGVTDSTAAIDAGIAALGEGEKLYFPFGTYVYNGDLDDIADKITGFGFIKVLGDVYPVVRQVAKSQLWQGFFASWQMAHALGVQDSQRRQVPAGVTHARLGFATATTMYHVEGRYAQDALRIQRNATTTSTAAHVMVINLTREETKPLNGQKCTLAFHCLAGANFSGSTITARVQYSDEPEQPILADNGEYTNGNQVLATKTITPAVRSESAPFYLTFDVPADATQVAVVFTIPWTGTAGVSDLVEIESVTLTTTEYPAAVVKESQGDILERARTRYQASYPYGAPRGITSEQGAVQAVASSASINWAFAIDVRFTPQMSTIPQFLFQSPTSGTESRLLNKDTAANVNGLAFNLSESGVTITNNAAVTAGHRFLCHWTAQVIF